MSAQIFEIGDIPPTLWNPDYIHNRASVPVGRLKLPQRLEQAYQQALAELGLTALASNIDDREGGPIGEKGEEGAREHFAKRFSGSCGRVQLFALDPHQTFKSTRNALAALFCGGTVRLLDIPLGAGAAAVTLISAVAQLREEEKPVFPKVDLDVQVVGGDHNPHQIALAERLFKILGPWWMENGVNVTLESREWDVLDDESTNDLVDHWKEGLHDAVVPAVVGANFSGFLGETVTVGGQRCWIDEAESCLRQIFAVVSKKQATVFWIEPNDKRSRRFLPKLRVQVFDRFSRIAPTSTTSQNSETFLADPIVVGGGFAVRASGLHLIPK